MGRPMINTEGQGLASSSALKFAVTMLVVAVIVLLIFFALNRTVMNHNSAAESAAVQNSGSAMAAPNPQAT